MRILDRPMTDIYADELCNPNFQITSAPPTSTLASPQNDVFSQRLQAANSQHLSASNTPSREQSPFRQGSPLAPSGNNFGAQSANLRFGTATQQQTHLACYQQQPAILQDPPESTHVTQPQGNFNAVASSVRQIPQRHPSVPLSSVTDDFPATLTSKESSSESETPESKKPSRTSADTGTYTCTFHGCTLRFETPAKLQQHKRDCHRKSAVAINGGDGNGMTSAAQRSSQAGPHKCERINPSTGKPCNTIFSRPYDLTRHENTIHNAKEKVHCPVCTEEKTFNRKDALKRHLRLVHPERVDLWKSRRRGGQE